MDRETTERVIVLFYTIPMVIVCIFAVVEKLRKKELSWRWYWEMVGLSLIPAYNFEMALVIVLDLIHLLVLFFEQKNKTN